MHTVLSYESAAVRHLAATRSSSPRSRRPPTSASCSTRCSSRRAIRRSASCCCSTRSTRSSAPSTRRCCSPTSSCARTAWSRRASRVTTDVLNKLYAGLLKEYWGDAVTVDDFYKWTWARIPHFFNSPYYVYQYATCFASSAQLYGAMTTRLARVAQGGDRPLPDAAQERRQRPPDDAAEEGRRRPHPAGDDPGRDRPDGSPGGADGGRGGEDPLGQPPRRRSVEHGSPTRLSRHELSRDPCGGSVRPGWPVGLRRRRPRLRRARRTPPPASPR